MSYFSLSWKLQNTLTAAFATAIIAVALRIGLHLLELIQYVRIDGDIPIQELLYFLSETWISIAVLMFFYVFKKIAEFNL